MRTGSRKGLFLSMLKSGDRFIVEVEGVTDEFLGKKYCKLKGLGAYTFPVECIEALPICEINEAVPTYEPVAQVGRVYRHRKSFYDVLVVRCSEDGVEYIHRQTGEVGCCTISLFCRDFEATKFSFFQEIGNILYQKTKE